MCSAFCSAGTGMAALRVPTSTISKVLNHAEGGVTRIYNRYSYGEEKREALATWANKLTSIISPTDDNVVPLRGYGLRQNNRRRLD